MQWYYYINYVNLIQTHLNNTMRQTAVKTGQFGADLDNWRSSLARFLAYACALVER